MAHLGKVTPRLTTFLQATLLCALPLACSTVGDDGGLFDDDPGGLSTGGQGNGNPGGIGDGNGDGDGGGSNDIPDGWSGAGVTLTGRVMSPTGEFPIAGALVFLTQTTPAPIPSGVYNYECDNMTGTPYALSKADGTWTIEDAPAGSYKIVTRKGNFRRIRDIEMVADTDQAVPEDVTTLPSAHSADARDTIPSFAVVKVTPDVSYNLLGKFGLGQMNGGELILNSARFHLYEDSMFGGGGLPSTQALFDNGGKLDDYHMIFLPCYASAVGVQYVNQHVQMLRDYVAKGGKIYNSCTASLWSEAPFPQYIEFYDSDATNKFDIGRRTSSDYTTQGKVNDQGLADWIPIVTNGNDPNNLSFFKGYVTIDNTVDVDDGHGLEENGGVVKPYTWVTDVGQQYGGSPLMVTYNYDYGKVFYSVYETSSGSPTITAQEFVLLYVILEVGVCTNLPPVVPPK